MNGRHDPRIMNDGSIRLNLNAPDEACLVPSWWGGKYPKKSLAARLTRLSEQQGHRCCYCGKRTWTAHYGEKGIWQDMATVEHILARNDGGTSKQTNIVMACSQCNNERDLSNPVVFMYENMGLLDFELVPKEDEECELVLDFLEESPYNVSIHIEKRDAHD